MPSFSLAVLISLFSATVLVTAAPQVRLGDTTVTGSFNLLTGLEFFGGIPFAQPPIGNLRYKPPVLKTTLNGTSFDATKFGLPCLQGATQSSEDCLTINLLRPGGITANSSIPVMVWIYGGGFTVGGSPTYDGSPIAKQSWVRGTPIIYVNFNYRLGPLGFPQGTEASLQGALNLGLKDQIAALEWVQRNIGAFGGDKTKVTVFGESAGAVSIGVHFLNPSFSNLARAGIFQSGSAGTTLLYPGAQRQAVWENYVKAVPACASLASTTQTFDCLRKQSSETLLAAAAVAESKAPEEFPWVPTLDGADGLFPDFPSKLYASGHFAHLPFISGCSLDEGTVFTPTAINSAQAIRDWIVANYTPPTRSQAALEAAADKIMLLYPDDPTVGSPYGTGTETFGFSSQYKRLASITGDMLFQANRRLWTQTAVGAGVKAYGYQFTDRPLLFPPELGVSHGLEILYIYGGLLGTLIGASPFLAAQMVDYWISFAVSLDPNDGKGTPRPKWPQYSMQDKNIMQLNSLALKPVPDTFREAQINFINQDPIIFRH